MKKSVLVICSYLIAIFAVIVGYTVINLESSYRIFMGIILFSALIITSVIVLKNFFKSSKPPQNSQLKYDRPILHFHEKAYMFSSKTIILFLIGAPLFIIIFYIFLNSEVNLWLNELAAKQTSFFLGSIFNVDSNVFYIENEWYIWIPNIGQLYNIHSWCTASHIFSIFTGIIIFIPFSLDFSTRRDISLRKVKALSFLILIIHIGNISRLAILLNLVSIGFPWEISHMLINYGTGIIAALLFMLVLYKWLPEFYISIYYIHPLRIEKRKLKN